LLGKSEVIDLALTCTYEGVRSRNDAQEALVTVAGKVIGRNATTKDIEGEVSGQFTLDKKENFISSAALKILSESTSPINQLQFTYAFEIELNRRAGNPLNLQLPAPNAPSAPTPPALKNVLLQL